MAVSGDGPARSTRGLGADAAGEPGGARACRPRRERIFSMADISMMAAKMLGRQKAAGHDRLEMAGPDVGKGQLSGTIKSDDWFRTPSSNS